MTLFRTSLITTPATRWCLGLLTSAVAITAIVLLLPSAAVGSPCDAASVRQLVLASAATGELRADFPDANDGAHVGISDQAGGWFVGGYFSCIGATPAAGLAHLDARGRLDRRWKAPAALLKDEAVVGLTLSDGVLFVASTAGVMALDARTGKLRWNVRADREGVTSVVADGALVYVGGPFDRIGTRLVAQGFAVLSARTGAWVRGAPKQWRMNDFPTLAIVGRELFVGAEFTADDGSVSDRVKSFELPSLVPTDWAARPMGRFTDELEICADELVIGGGMVMVSCDHEFRVYDLKTGRLQDWNARIDGVVRQFAVQGSRVFVGGSCGNRFWSIDGRRRFNLAAVRLPGGKVDAWAPRFRKLYCVSDIAVDAKQVLLVGQLLDEEP